MAGNGEFLWETKYDGERLQVHLDSLGSQVRYYSRNLHEVTSLYSGMDKAILTASQASRAILDGELVVVDRGGNPQPFGKNKTVAKLSSQEQEREGLFLQFMVFDLLYVETQGETLDLLDIPLLQRKALLAKSITPGPGVTLVRGTPVSSGEQLKTAFLGAVGREEEGLVVKHVHSCYKTNSRGLEWVKMKADYVEGMADSLDLVLLGGYY